MPVSSDSLNVQFTSLANQTVSNQLAPSPLAAGGSVSSYFNNVNIFNNNKEVAAVTSLYL